MCMHVFLASCLATAKQITHWLYFAMQLDSSRPDQVSQDTAGLVRQDLIGGGGGNGIYPYRKEIMLPTRDTHTPGYCP